MKIEVLGSGCKKCTNLAEHVNQVATEMGLQFELEKVTDMVRVMEYGVMSTPAIVINGEVKVAGQVPDADGIKALLSAA